MCHRRYYRDRVEYRSEEPTQTLVGAPEGPVRAGDADRERVAELLRRNAAEGRLEAAELEQRLEAVYAATYVHDLDTPVADLPPEPAARPAPAARTRAIRSGAIAGVPLIILAVVLLAIITSATGAWMLWWLMWPIAIALGPRRRYRHGWRV